MSLLIYAWGACHGGFFLLTPKQGSNYLSSFQKSLDIADSDVTAELHIIRREPSGAISIIKLLRTFASGPLRVKTGYHARDFVAVDAVATFIGTTIGGV